MFIKVPVANIFHLDKRRRRRRRRRTAEPVEIGQSQENVESAEIRKIQENAGDLRVTHTHPDSGPSIGQLILEYSSNSSKPNSANISMSIKVDKPDDSTITEEVIEAETKDDLKEGITEKAKVSEENDNLDDVTTTESGEVFIWNDYEDYYDEDYEYIEIKKDDERYYKPEPRIDYNLFGKQTEEDIVEDR